jgi:HlyD family secretion protein
MPETTLQQHAPSTRRRRRLRRWIKRAIFALAALGIATALVYAWLPKPVVVDVATVTRQKLEVFVEGDGRSRVRERFVVASPIGGTLARIELEPGDAVAADHPVAYVDPPDPAILDARTRTAAEARIAAAIANERRAESAIVRARAGHDVARNESQRVRKLVQSDAATGSELERVELAEQLAIGDLREAELARSSAHAELASARAALGRGVRRSEERIAIRSPAAGRVLRVLRDSAGPVQPGTPLLEIGEPCDLELVIDVLSSDAAQIAVGARVVVENWGGAPFEGRVRRVEPSAFTQVSALGIDEQRVNVIVGVEAPPDRLGDAFRVEAKIVIWESADVVAIPASALFRDRDRWAVYVAVDGVAELRAVEPGHRGRLDVEIVSGLRVGERVISHPGDRVTAGARIATR